MPPAARTGSDRDPVQRPVKRYGRRAMKPGNREAEQRMRGGAYPRRREANDPAQAGEQDERTRNRSPRNCRAKPGCAEVSRTTAIRPPAASAIQPNARQRPAGRP